MGTTEMRCKWCGEALRGGPTVWLHLSGWFLCENHKAFHKVVEYGNAASPDTELHTVDNILAKYYEV